MAETAQDSSLIEGGAVVAPRSTEMEIMHDESVLVTCRRRKPHGHCRRCLIMSHVCFIWPFLGFLAGVLTRYSLEKLFGPLFACVTSDFNPLYLDLPSNVVGSFLMGWWGVVFKAHISSVSDHLAIGLTTGYLGSLTTFSGWNQKMLDLIVDGKWLSAVFGYAIGLLLTVCAIKLGVWTAKRFQLAMQRLNGGQCSSSKWSVNTHRRHLTVMIALALLLGLLWTRSGTLLSKDFSSTKAPLWIACLVSAPGVWIRWFLARRLNDRGLGTSGTLKWVPFGTLIANISVSCIMAGLATVKKAVDTKKCDMIVTGIQFGFLGCLSTVSTFMAEFHALEESSKSWRAYVYELVTMLPSCTLGIVIYDVPVWSKGYS